MKTTSKQKGVKFQKLYTCELIISGYTIYNDRYINWHTADHQLWIFRAASLREATAKALVEIAEQTRVYKNSYGEEVSWQCDGRPKIRLLATDAELDAGIEVRSEMKDHPKYDAFEDARHELPFPPPPQE